MHDIKPVRVFLKVVALSSFAAAARELKMTPASVTRIVAKLETELGQQLLVRTTRQVSLTSAGAIVAARFGSVVAEFDSITEELTQATRPDRGRLKINAPMSLGIRMLPALADRFRLAYPHISLDLRLTDTLVDIVEEDCDLAIRVSGPPNDKSTIWRKVCEVPRQIIAAPCLFERMQRPVAPHDIDPAFCLSYSPDGQPEVWKLRKDGLKRNVSAGTSVISNNGDFLLSMVQSGNGMALLPNFIAQDAIVAGDVVSVLDGWTIDPLWLTLFYPPYEVLPPLVATFTDLFEAHLREVDALNFQGNA